MNPNIRTIYVLLHSTFKMIQLDEIQKSVIALGTFDGVHLGHQEIIKELLFIARNKQLKPIIVTFFPHPSHVFNAENPLKMLNSIEERVKHIKQLGVEAVYVQEFTKDFANISAREFVETVLLEELKMETLIMGHDHSFGKNKEGDYEMLQSMGSKFHFNVVNVQPFITKSQVVSSTLIRNYINEGNFDKANELLGYPFCLFGKVVQGNQLGRKIGFNTANIVLDYSNKIVPRIGVYIVSSFIEEKWYYGMMNIGYRPTVDGKTQTIEIHFFDLNMDLYFQKLKVKVLHWLRDEFHFESVDHLKNQLQTDKMNARKWIENQNK